MIRSFLHNLRQEDGTAVVLLALSLSVLIGFATLVTDLGSVYINRTRISNTLDSAVLAGAQELPFEPDAALDKAEQYALANGMKLGEYTFIISEDSYSITGTANRTVGMFFARAFGIESKDIDARAGARVAPAAGVGGLAPFGVHEDDFVFGQEVTLKDSPSDPSDNIGWFLYVQLGGGGTDTLIKNIRDGYPEEVEVGQRLLTQTGVADAVTSTINARIDSCPHIPQCTYTNYETGCPRIFLVPIIKPVTWNPAGGVSEVEVVSFGAFLVEQPVGHGVNNELVGYFIHEHVPATVSDDVAYTGVYGVELIE